MDPVMKPNIPNISESPGDEGSDARMELTNDGGEVIATASLWWRDTPVMDGAKIGTIGNFTAEDEAATKILLDGASDHLRDKGCAHAVGPMNGNTWRKHRFVVEDGGRGPFLLEPRNPPEHPAWWEQAGFTTLSRYSSSVMRLNEGDAFPAAVKTRLERNGVKIRKLVASRYDDELRLIHAVSARSFTDNFLYTPLDLDAFLQAYRKVRDHVDPDLVRIAERDGEPCGFVFGIPDLEAAARGEKPALVVKTLAVDPESRCAGLGNLLVDELHRIGREKGYTEAIHALQHETNTSLKITGRHQGEAIRRYALFFRKL
jgi:ribosomal protein S18 acetylase RimI-like enzyme